MTPDFFLGQLRLIAVALIAFATGKGWLSSADSTMLGAILPPVGLLIGPWLWSIYANVNRKLVPADSVAIAKEHIAGAAVVGNTVTVVGDTSAASPGMVKIVGAILILVMSTALLLPGPTMAQGKTKTAATTTHGMPCDPAHLLPGCQTTLDASGNPIEQILSQPMQQLADFIAGGFDDAVTLSTAVSNLQDGNGQACWSVLREYSAVLKAHPIPITLKFAADLESLRLLNMAAKKVCQTASCTQVFNELTNGITSLSPISIPIPSISALCAKVPDIAVVAATPAPIITPTPTPSPSPTP